MLCAYINTIKPKQNQWVVLRYVLLSSFNPYSYEILNKEVQHVGEQFYEAIYRYCYVLWRYEEMLSTMYDIFGTGRDIKKYLHRTVDPDRLFMYSDFPISIICTLYKKCTFEVLLMLVTLECNKFTT